MGENERLEQAEIYKKKGNRIMGITLLITLSVLVLFWIIYYKTTAFNFGYVLVVDMVVLVGGFVWGEINHRRSRRERKREVGN